MPGATEKLTQMLDWAGIGIDEGPSQGGDYGPYLQVRIQSRLTDCRSAVELRQEDRTSGYLLGFCLFIRVIYAMLPPHGHCRNLYFYKQLQICISIYFVLM